MGNSTIGRMAYLQGISDFMRYKSRCPVYWKGTEQEGQWRAGHNYAKDYTRWIK